MGVLISVFSFRFLTVRSDRAATLPYTGRYSGRLPKIPRLKIYLCRYEYLVFTHHLSVAISFL